VAAACRGGAEYDRGHGRYEYDKATAVNFKGEGAIDDGACTREMFSQFFEQLFCETSPYFEGQRGDGGSESVDAAVRASYLPRVGSIERDPGVRTKLVAIGKVLMKALTDDICMAQCMPPSFFDYLIEPRYAVPADVYDALNSLSFFDRQQAKILSNMLGFDEPTIAELAHGPWVT
jgi:hypothetical protein